jgi:hypothetical protein
MLILPLMLGACVLPMMSASPTAAPAQSAVTQQFSGSGMSVNAYQVDLKAGVARFHVVSDSALTIDFAGPGAVNQVKHTGASADSTYDAQIPADGTYQITINHAGAGSWAVTIEAPGAVAQQPTALSAATQAPAAAPATQQPISAPAALQQFNGSGISVNEHQATLKAGVNRFHVVSESVLTIDFNGPGAVSQLLHTGVLADSAYDVQVPADGSYQLTISHAGLGNWTVTIEASGAAAPQPTALPAATQAPAAAPATQQPNSPPAAAQQFSGSGISVDVYQVTLKAGIAHFHVVSDSALTIDFTGPGAVDQVKHTGAQADSTYEVQIPVDGVYQIGINHASLGSWTVTVTQ